MSAISISRIVHQPYQLVRAALGDPSVLGTSSTTGLTTCLSARIGDTVVHREAHIDVGIPADAGSKLPVVSIPVTVRAEHHPRLFPRFEGTIEAVGEGLRTTELSLVGRYAPPAAWIGAVGDRAALHSIAEECLRGWLHQIADAVVAVASDAHR